MDDVGLASFGELRPVYRSIRSTEPFREKEKEVDWRNYEERHLNGFLSYSTLVYLANSQFTILLATCAQC